MIEGGEEEEEGEEEGRERVGGEERAFDATQVWDWMIGGEMDLV
jgi:hypothetical protein